MSIAHFFDKPPVAAVETGAERQLLLEANHELRRQNTLLQARVDELAGKASKWQASTMPPRSTPAAIPLPVLAERVKAMVDELEEFNGPMTTCIPDRDTADRYLSAMRAMGRPCTPLELATSLGLRPETVRHWLRLHASALGIRAAGMHKGHGRPAQLYEIGDPS